MPPAWQAVQLTPFLVYCAQLKSVLKFPITYLGLVFTGVLAMIKHKKYLFTVCGAASSWVLSVSYSHVLAPGLLTLASSS